LPAPASPQMKNSGLAVGRRQPGGQTGQRFSVAAGDKILEAGRIASGSRSRINWRIGNGFELRMYAGESARGRAISDKIRFSGDQVVHSTTAQHRQPCSGPLQDDSGISLLSRCRCRHRRRRSTRRTYQAVRPKDHASGCSAASAAFGALFEVPRNYREPVLVSGTDGVGTKLKLAFELQRHDTIGIDLVAMSVNDILVQGAEPLFFLDYFACGKLDVDTAADVVKGIARGCELAGCALIGGETAEMPGMYPAGEYDLAGFAVGVVEKSAIIDGSTIVPGDVLLGLPSSACAFQRLLAGPQDHCPRAARSDTCLRRRSHARRCDPGADADLRQAAAGADAIAAGQGHGAHHRWRPDRQRAAHPAATVKAEIAQAAWPRPKLFDWLQREGGVADSEMHRVFNCGIGMVVVVAREDVQQAPDPPRHGRTGGGGHRQHQAAHSRNVDSFQNAT
jgi:phosphoribosylformylglycinamidine cyclo-ligase